MGQYPDYHTIRSLHAPVLDSFGQRVAVIFLLLLSSLQAHWVSIHGYRVRIQDTCLRYWLVLIQDRLRGSCGCHRRLSLHQLLVQVTQLRNSISSILDITGQTVEQICEYNLYSLRSEHFD